MRKLPLLLILFLLLPLFAASPVQGQSCHVVVTLLSIDILNDGDFLGEGEIFVETQADVPIIGPTALRIPPAGSVSRGSGDTWFINTVFFDGTAPASMFPTTIHIVIQVWDDDSPNPNDPLGRVDEVFPLPCPSDVTVHRQNAQDGESGMHFRIQATGGGAGTDWAALSVGLNPAAPRVGDSVTFRMIMSALSTSGSYPQNVAVQCQVDGAPCGSGTVTYPGPTGVSFTVTTITPWPATLGTHTLTWSVSTAGDPNPSNNVMSTTFTVQPAQAQFDFGVSVSPPEQTVTPGGTATFGVNVNLVAGSTENVILSLSGAPSGITGVFDPPSGNPSFSSTLRLSTTSSLSPGSYSMIVTGTGGGRTHTASIVLVVSQAPDFRIEVSPPSQTVNQGQTASYSVNIVGLNGFNSQVSLSVSGLPSGASGVFSVPSGTPNFQSTLTVTLPGNVQTGSFTLTIRGTGGGLDRVANVVLVINPAPQTQTQTVTSPGGGFLPGGGLTEFVEQNSLLLVAILALLILMLVVLALRRRKSAYPPPTKPCPTCGQALMYVPQYYRWYCNNCKAYK